MRDLETSDVLAQRTPSPSVCLRETAKSLGITLSDPPLPPGTPPIRPDPDGPVPIEEPPGPIPIPPDDPPPPIIEPPAPMVASACWRGVTTEIGTRFPSAQTVRTSV